MSGPAAHALFSASGGEGWMLCAPKLAAEQGQEDSTSKYAAEGTAAHELASWCLEAVAKNITLVSNGQLPPDLVWTLDGTRAEHYIGHGIEADGFPFEVDEDMAGHVQTYVDAIRDRIADFYLRGAVNVTLLVEVRVDYSRYIGQPNSFGTSDVVILVEWPDDIWQVDVGDLKYGMGVRVYASSRIVGEPDKDWRAEGNKQMMLYALGALDQYSMVCEPTIFSMTIYQPRLQHEDSFECDLETLIRFADEAKQAAETAAMWIAQADQGQVIPITAYTPGEKQCRWCKVGGSCVARTEKNLRTLAGDFDDLDEALTVHGVDAAGGLDQTVIAEVVRQGAKFVHTGDARLLDALYPNLDEIDNWVKAVRGEIEKRALAGETFTTCKLVQGKKGNRAWRSESEAEKAMKSMRLKTEQMYTFKLITPTRAEELAPKKAKTSPKGGEVATGVKTVIGVKQWNRLKELITQSDGAISVAPINDKRAAVVITPPADDFDVLPTADFDVLPTADFDDLA